MDEIKPAEPVDITPKAILKKHSALIAMKSEITASQRKMYNALLFIAGKQLSEEPDRQMFKVRFSDIKKYSGLSGEHNHKHLKSALKELQERSIEYNIMEKDKEVEWGAFSLLSEVKITHKDEYISFAFPPTIQNNIVRPNIYALLNLGIISSLKSKYAIALYEMMQDYKKIKKIRIDIDTLRKMMGVDEAQYKIFTTFKTKVIDSAVDEINEKTDLKIRYNLEQVGRKYSAIVFQIDKMNPEQLRRIEIATDNDTSISEEDREKRKLILKMVYYGISEKRAEEISDTMTFDEIESGIEVLENALKSKEIKNTGGYLSVLLNNGASLDSLFVNEKQHKQKEIIQEIQKKESQAKELEELKNTFNAIYEEQTKDIITRVTQDDIDDFLNTNNSQFMISYMQTKSILDNNGKLIEQDKLLNFQLFIEFMKSKYYPFDEEFAKYCESI